MSEFDRRAVVTSLAAAAGTLAARGALAAPVALAQTKVAPRDQPPPKFGYDDVIRRARELSGAPLSPTPPLPDVLSHLDYDAWRNIRFRPEHALLSGSPFRLQTFHLGYVYKRPVTVNIIRDGIATPIPYAANLFDYGRAKLDKPLPVNLGFAGFRLHYPVNEPRVYDEAIAFLGASYFRFLGRGQRYGLSARALAVNAGADNEEFPFFREFWVETPDANAEQATIYGLLDGELVTGAYRFDLRPGINSTLDVSATLFMRRAGAKIGMAPLTSMFLANESTRRSRGDFRPEIHDSDGLLMRSGSEEWIWRPLRNPAKMTTSTFHDNNVRGFGLIQRDRDFSHYQDLDLAYESRPSYWVEPTGDWGEGGVDLIELPTTDENNDNIVASWTPSEAPTPEKPVNFGYRVTACLDLARMSPNGRVVNIFQAPAGAPGASDPPPPNSRRFIIDFAGGDLAYYLTDPSTVEVVPTANNGHVLGVFIAPNPHIQGFRAGIDVQAEPGQSADLRAFLRSGAHTLTETWTFPWTAE